MLLIFGTTPKEFIHLFADHKDTIEHAYHADAPGIENQHHHCDFLSFSLMPFANDIQLPYLNLYTEIYFSRHQAISIDNIQRCIVSTSLRGPPTA